MPLADVGDRLDILNGRHLGGLQRSTSRHDPRAS